MFHLLLEVRSSLKSKSRLTDAERERRAAGDLLSISSTAAASSRARPPD